MRNLLITLIYIVFIFIYNNAFSIIQYSHITITSKENIQQIIENCTLYTVEENDTLASIAEKFYDGDYSQWNRIYQFNRDVIGDDYNLIQPGMVLKIPK